MNKKRRQPDERRHWAEFPDIGALLLNDARADDARFCITDERFIGYRTSAHDISKAMDGPWRFEIHDTIDDKRYVAEGTRAAGVPHSRWSDDLWLVQSAAGDAFEGMYHRGKRHGLWNFKYADGSRREVRFYDGEVEE